MYPAMKIHAYAYVVAHSFPDGGEPFNGLIDFVIRIHVLHFLGGIHFYGKKTLGHHFLGRQTYVYRTIPADPGINLDAVPGFSSQKLVDWRIMVLAFDIPKRLIDPRNRTH